MLRVPDAASVATAHWLETQLGRKVGASTGTNMWGAQLAARMREEGAPVPSSRCCATAASVIWKPITTPQWVQANIGDIAPGRRRLRNC
jgi:cysteine synthase A